MKAYTQKERSHIISRNFMKLMYKIGAGKDPMYAEIGALIEALRFGSSTTIGNVGHPVQVEDLELTMKAASKLWK